MNYYERYCKIFTLLLLLLSFVTVREVRSSELTSDQRKNPAVTQDAAAMQPVIGGAPYNERVSDVIASNVLRFGYAIGQRLSSAWSTEFSKSEIFSPVSLMSAMALLLLGAKGKTYNELKQVLGLDLDAELTNNPQLFHQEFANMLDDLPLKDGYSSRVRHKVNWRLTNVRYKPQLERNNKKPYEHIIKIANGLFVQPKYSFNPNYREVVQSVYHAQFMEVDFENRPTEARNNINRWVNVNTNGQIPQIISGPLPRSTNLIMASVLYFKGFWENSFIESVTTADNFYPDGPHSQPIRVKMMATGGVFPYYDAVEYDCRIIGLPYRGNLSTMYIIMPNYSTRAKLRDLHRSLDANKIEDMISKMSMKTSLLALPKMHITRTTNMRDVLIRMGINDIFAQGFSDLSLIGEPNSTPYAGFPTATSVPESAASALLPQSTAPQTIMDRYNEAPLIFSRFGEEAVEDGSGKTKRETRSIKSSLDNLEYQRISGYNLKSDFFVEDILHKVDFTVNEQGTEAAAATLTYLRRSGTDVVFRVEAPFLVLIRHDPTKLPLFYGIINEPES